MNILIMHATVSNHDAIGNDIEMMANVLAKNNSVYIYTEDGKNPRLTYVTYPKAMSIAKDPEAVIIYHHSVYWNGGYELLKQAKARIIFKYHNITPPYFFKNLSKNHCIACGQGIQQTKILQEEFPNANWFCDSQFNAEDLFKVNPNRLAIVPPFNKVEKFEKNTVPDRDILEEIKKSRSLNLLFVGRIVPNKGHLLLLDILYAYKQTYESNITLRIVGKLEEPLKNYKEIIERKIKECGLDENVKFISDVSDETLCALYKSSDIFLCTSLHEGFCVPIIEAQYFGLPVIALRSSAVSETIGKGQIVLERDVRKFIASIRKLENINDIREILIENGKLNYNTRFSSEVTQKIFLAAFNQALLNDLTNKNTLDAKPNVELFDRFNKVYDLFKLNVCKNSREKYNFISNWEFTEFMYHSERYI